MKNRVFISLGIVFFILLECVMNKLYTPCFVLGIIALILASRLMGDEEEVA